MKKKLVLDEKYYSLYGFVAGCDEAGRGCLLGPVVAGAVILPKDFHNDLIQDSKKLTEKQREEALIIIKENIKDNNFISKLLTSSTCRTGVYSEQREKRKRGSAKTILSFNR